MHFNCDFHACALMKRRREARIPLSAASGAACISLCIDLPKVSLFQLPDRPNRPELNGYVPPAWVLNATIPIPILQSCIGFKISYVYKQALSSHQRFQLVELDLGWCKPAHPLQRRTYYETITIVWQSKSLVKTHKSPNLTTVTARKWKAI